MVSSTLLSIVYHLHLLLPYPFLVFMVHLILAEVVMLSINLPTIESESASRVFQKYGHDQDSCGLSFIVGASFTFRNIVFIGSTNHYGEYPIAWASKHIQVVLRNRGLRTSFNE
jgi:hypothetical protein